MNHQERFFLFRQTGGFYKCDNPEAYICSATMRQVFDVHTGFIRITVSPVAFKGGRLFKFFSEHVFSDFMDVTSKHLHRPYTMISHVSKAIKALYGEKCALYVKVEDVVVSSEVVP